MADQQQQPGSSNMADGSDVITHQVAANQVVHVRQNSQQEIDNLFACLKKSEPSQDGSIGSGWRNKDMPASFFDPKIRSRESSIDHGSAPPPAHPRGLSLDSGSLTMRPILHVKSSSYGGDLDDRASIPLPAGWEQAFTPDGKSYYINHNNRSTSWEDPRKIYLNQLNQMRAPLNGLSPAAPVESPLVGPGGAGVGMGGAILPGTLPEGWQRASTPAGEPYFINHMDKTTSWFDPRLLRQGGSAAGRPHQMGAMMGPPGLSSPCSSPSMPFPGAMSPGGGQAALAQRPPSSAGTPTHQRVPSIEFSRQMQQMQLGKGKTPQQQEQLLRQQQMMAAMSGSGDPMEGPPPPNFPGPPQHGDPFLGGATGPAPQHPGEYHARQESTDSGLGGMNAAGMVMAKTPEGFMAAQQQQVAAAQAVQQQQQGGPMSVGPQPMGEDMDVHVPSGIGGQARMMPLNGGLVGGGVPGGAPMEMEDNSMNDMSLSGGVWL